MQTTKGNPALKADERAEENSELETDSETATLPKPQELDRYSELKIMGKDYWGNTYLSGFKGMIRRGVSETEAFERIRRIYKTYEERKAKDLIEKQRRLAILNAKTSPEQEYLERMGFITYKPSKDKSQVNTQPLADITPRASENSLPTLVAIAFSYSNPNNY